MRCLVCNGPLPELAIQHEDEFCSSACARSYHGCPLPVPKSGPAAGLGKAATARFGEAVRPAAVPSHGEFYDLELLAQLEDEAA